MTFTVVLANTVPAGGMMSVVYPSQVSVSSANLSVSLLSPSTIASLSFILTSSTRRIDITNMFSTSASAGSTYSFKLNNVKNSDYAAATSSFQLTTYTDSTGSYRIDRTSSGLTMTANCDYP